MAAGDWHGERGEVLHIPGRAGVAPPERVARPLRVIAWPAFANQGQNPYNALLYRSLTDLGLWVEDFSPERLLFGRYDVWHIHWPESILNLPRLWQALPLAFVLRFLLRRARARGVKIVWTAHNLRSHEGLYPRVEAQLWRALLANLDGFIALTDEGKALVLRHFPALRSRPGFVIPHGSYRAAYPDTLAREEARARLGLPPGARVLVSLGQVRPYKNLPHLIRTFGQLPDPAAVLLIAGKPSTPALAAELEALTGADRRVRLALAFVPPDQVQVYLRAADLVVLPYREILNSGSAILALSFARPVLVPAQGALTELQRQAGPDWVRTYSEECVADTLRRALDWAIRTPRAASSPLPEPSWETIARQTLHAYQSLRG